MEVVISSTRRPSRGARRAAVLRQIAEAGLATVDGRTDEATRLFEEACDETERIEGALSAARARALYALTVPEAPGAAEAARLAHDWFADRGAVGFLELYREAWRHHLPEAASA